MSKKLTQHQAICEHLARTSGWVPSYDLSKVTLVGIWVGSRGERSARDLFSNDCLLELQNLVDKKEGSELLREGITTDYKGREINKTYAYYTSFRPKKVEELYITLPDGTKQLVGTRYV